MRVTRSKSGAAPKQPDADVALQKTFAGQSLLAWAGGSRKSKKSGSTVRKPQNNAPILNLPLDLLAIIFAYCEPSDLLQLARTCQDLKVFFCSEASKGIWTASRKGLAFGITEEDVKIIPPWQSPKAGTFCLPDTPSYFSEPAYAAYLFEPSCTYCHAEDDGIHNFERMTTPACYTCLHKDLVSLKTLKAEWKQDADPRLYSILPHIDARWDGKKPRVNDRVYHKPTCQAIFDRYFEYDLKVNFDTRMMNAFFTKAEKEIKEREAFAETYSAFKTAKSNHTYIEHHRIREELEERRKRNKDFAVMRLEQEGFEVWATDIDDSTLATGLINIQDGKMDETKFAEIKSDLIDSLEPVQDQRRYLCKFYDPENIRIRDILDVHRSSLPQVEGLAAPIRLADFVELPTCRMLADNHDFVNGDAATGRQIWEANLDNILQDIAAWINAKELHILILLEKAKATGVAASQPAEQQQYETELSQEFLRMPYTRFACPDCGSGITFTLSEILVHECCEAYDNYSLYHTRRRLNNEGIDTDAVAFSSPILINDKNLKLDWSSTFIGKHMYEAIVKVSGEPPKTLAAIRNKAGQIKCADCPQNHPERSGTSVKVSYARHCGYISSNPSLHRRFTYMLPSGGVEADFNDDAETPPAYGLGLYDDDSDHSIDSYLDYMHGGMMGDMDADMMMDAIMGEDGPFDDWD